MHTSWLTIDLMERLIVESQAIEELLQLGDAGIERLPLLRHRVAVRRETFGEEHVLVLHAAAFVARRATASSAFRINGRGAWLNRQTIAILEADAALPFELYRRRTDIVHRRCRARTLHQRALRVIDARVAL